MSDYQQSIFRLTSSAKQYGSERSFCSWVKLAVASKVYYEKIVEIGNGCPPIHFYGSDFNTYPYVMGWPLSVLENAALAYARDESSENKAILKLIALDYSNFKPGESETWLCYDEQRKRYIQAYGGSYLNRVEELKVLHGSGS